MNKKDELKGRFKEYFKIEENIVPPFPKNMLMELNNVCNHSCIFCANSKMTKKKCFIDEKFALRILEEAYDLGVREVGFYSTGEPLINKNLELYIKKAKELGYEYVYITTNGALLDKHRVDSLVQSGIDSIKFSINAGTKESYKFVHGEDDFETVIKNLIYLSEYRKMNNKKFKIFISCILTRYTIDDKQIILDSLGGYVDDIVYMNCRNQCGVMYELNHLLTVTNRENVNFEKCPLPFNKLHITCDGYLTACCADFQNYLVVSDLNVEPLSNAWKNEVFIELRRKHIEKNLEGTQCYNCTKNIQKEINPLVLEYSTKYESIDFNKTEEIINRIKTYKNRN